MEKWLAAYKSYNISETGQDKTKATIGDDGKTHRPTRFRLMPKSTTLDDLEGSLCTLFQNICARVLLHIYIGSHSVCCQALC